MHKHTFFCVYALKNDHQFAPICLFTVSWYGSIKKLLLNVNPLSEQYLTMIIQFQWVTWKTKNNRNRIPKSRIPKSMQNKSENFLNQQFPFHQDTPLQWPMLKVKKQRWKSYRSNSFSVNTDIWTKQLGSYSSKYRPQSVICRATWIPDFWYAPLCPHVVEVELQIKRSEYWFDMLLFLGLKLNYKSGEGWALI